MATEEMKALPKSSSEEPRFTEIQEKLFREVLELFNHEDVLYVLSGAFALHEYTGIWRNTKDLDLFLPAKAAVRALHVLRTEGFRTEIADPVWIAKACLDGFNVDLITGMNNATIEVDESWIERSLPAVAMGVPTRVLGPEELIASKVFVTRRERFDAADICHVLHCRGRRLDWDRLFDLLKRHGDHTELLLWHLILFHYIYPGDVDVVPRRVWDELLNRLQRSLERPEPGIPFRGSLIDENMFYIDVAEWGLPDLTSELRAQRPDQIPAAAATDVQDGLVSCAVRRPAV